MDWDLETNEVRATGPGWTPFQRLINVAVATVTPEDFGAVGDGATDDTAALQAAINSLTNGGTVLLAPKVYRITAPLLMRSGVILQGAGFHGQWVPGRAASMTGTHILAAGAATKTLTAMGVTDERTSGGRLSNTADADFAPTDNWLSLASFYNENANVTTGAAATVAPFSAAVVLPHSTAGAGIYDLRILLNFSGVDGYNNATLTLADDWDVGLYLDNARNNSFANIQVVGYWRKAGVLIRTSSDPSEVPAGSFAGAERNVFGNSIFQGWKSVSIRGGGMWAVQASTTTTIDVPWADNHPFPSSGTVNVGEYSSVTYTYTGVSKVGGVLRFTGVTPDASGIAVNSPLVVARFSNGVAGTVFDNCYLLGMWHASGRRISDPAITGALPPSACLEVSGARIRGLMFPRCKFQTVDDIHVHLHQTSDVVLAPSIQAEEVTPTGGARGARWIATPSTTMPSSTYRVWVDFQQIIADLTPTYGTRSAKFSTDGFWTPNISAGARALLGLQIGGDLTTNYLSRYEQSSYTPILTAASGSLTITSQTRVGRYVILGNMCMFSATVECTFSYSGATGNLQWSLPATAANVTGFFQNIPVHAANVDFPAGYTQIMGRVAPNESVMTFYFVGNDQPQRLLQVTDIPSGTTNMTLRASGVFALS